MTNLEWPRLQIFYCFFNGMENGIPVLQNAAKLQQLLCLLSPQENFTEILGHLKSLEVSLGHLRSLTPFFYFCWNLKSRICNLCNILWNSGIWKRSFRSMVWFWSLGGIPETCRISHGWFHMFICHFINCWMLESFWWVTWSRNTRYVIEYNVIANFYVTVKHIIWYGQYNIWCLRSITDEVLRKIYSALRHIDESLIVITAKKVNFFCAWRD